MRIGRICAAILMMALVAKADVKMPAIFGDHMVLQQGIDLPVWGWADPGESITVSAAGRSATATADATGKWMVKLPRLDTATTPIEVTVRGKNSLVFHDVLVGEVWVCSGQSNMEYRLAGAHNATSEIPQADHPTIRLFTVAHKITLEPQTDCQGKWIVCTPQTAAPFSAVGYFFGRDIQAKRGGAVGLIHTSWGGTAAQAWTGLSGLQSHPELNAYVKTVTQIKDNFEQLNAKYQQELAACAPQFQAWKAQFDSAPAEQKAELIRRRPRGPNPPFFQNTPTALYNGMIAPLVPFAIRGAIWYQGESNASRYIQYRTLFPAMITDWRKAWGQGDFPFLFVQLANYMPRKDLPSEDGWAGLREAQLMTLSLPKTGMAVAIDIGQGNDIHPRDKMDVGARLAKAALHVAYGEDGEYSGPIYKSMNVEGDKIRLRFTHVGSGLTIAAAPSTQPNVAAEKPASALKGFAIAGADRKFVWAEAKIEGDCVLVWSDQVKAPVAVRYGWANNPQVNLYNKEALPASPFRTDDWEP